MYEYTSSERNKIRNNRFSIAEVRISLCLELPASSSPSFSSFAVHRWRPLWKESKERGLEFSVCKSRFPSRSCNRPTFHWIIVNRDYSLKGGRAFELLSNLRVSRICDWLFVGSGTNKVYGMEGDGYFEILLLEFTWFLSAAVEFNFFAIFYIFWNCRRLVEEIFRSWLIWKNWSFVY